MINYFQLLLYLWVSIYSIYFIWETFCFFVLSLVSCEFYFSVSKGCNWLLPEEAFWEYLVVRFWRSILNNNVVKVVRLCNQSVFCCSSI